MESVLCGSNDTNSLKIDRFCLIFILFCGDNIFFLEKKNIITTKIDVILNILSKKG